MSGQPGRSGGARPGSGPIQVRLRLDREAAKALRILTMQQRSATGNQALMPDEVAAAIIIAAYDAAAQEDGDDG